MDKDFCLNIKKIPKELKLLLELMKDHNETFIQENKAELFTDIDWDLFITLSIFHRFYPTLYPKLKMEEGIPPYVLNAFCAEYKKNTFQMLYLSAQMENISKLFTENEIPVLFLKGPALAQDLYGDLSLRTSSDLDLLVPINKVEEIEILLLNQGYEKNDLIRSVLGDWKWRHYHCVYIHPQKNIKIEIHWRLHPGPGKEPSFTELWGRKRKCLTSNYPVYILGKEDLFLFLVGHGARHGWFRLRWLMDIHQILRQDLRWNLVNKLINSYYNNHVVGQAIILSSQLFNTKIPQKMSHLLTYNLAKRMAQASIFYFEDMINPHTEPIPEYISRYNKKYLFSLKSTKQKIIFILSFLYPYPEDAEIFPLPKKIHFLYFPLRPIIWAWRKTRKHVVT